MTPVPLTPEEIKVGLAITILMVLACVYGIHLGGTWEAEKNKKGRSKKPTEDAPVPRFNQLRDLGRFFRPGFPPPRYPENISMTTTQPDRPCRGKSRATGKNDQGPTTDSAATDPENLDRLAGHIIL